MCVCVGMGWGDVVMMWWVYEAVVLLLVWNIHKVFAKHRTFKRIKIIERTSGCTAFMIQYTCNVPFTAFGSIHDLVPREQRKIE